MRAVAVEERLALLGDRGERLAAARRFFADRSILEVDTPILSRYASVDESIDLMVTHFAGRERLFLHSSPEYGMKRLLAAGSGDIYQLSHVFRDGERGERHRPEFTMAEWYRCGFSFQQMIDETVEFAALFSQRGGVEQLTYREALERFAGIDPFAATLAELREVLQREGVTPFATEDRDELLNLIMGCLVEPQLQGDCWWVITHYPATQSALAQIVDVNGIQVAERFELYAGGLELANGYCELADPEEQARRAREANRKRIAAGRPPLPIDEQLLEALRGGFPDCCGVAVGFDRLMMVRWGATSIGAILPGEAL